jgi:hydroxyacylglutathione hydrolase
MLYDSIFGKVLPLGDDVILCPAHGAGSVCGEAIAERLWTTIGLEKKNNPRLQYNRDKKEFVAVLLKSQPERPPYFGRMEKLNLMGSPILGALPSPKPLSPKDFGALAENENETGGANAQVVDTRMELGFGAAHVPGALSIWMGGLASFAGWFLTYDTPILLVNETNDPEEAMRILIRLGFDNIAGYLAGGMLNWHMFGKESSSIRMINVQETCRLLDLGEQIWILDVRRDGELKKDGRIPGAQHIHITQVPKHLQEIPRDKKVYIFCGSGLRSTVVASFLQQNGWKELAVILGGMAGWKSKRFPIER